MNTNDEMLDEYDFSNGVRGKYATAYKDGDNVIKLDKDISKFSLMPSLSMKHCVRLLSL